MATHIKISNCRIRSSQRRRRGASDGMVLLIVMAVATLLLIALTAALPSIYQEGQREREAELIFRGTQYGRAVALFHKQFGRYPASTKELLQTNGMRFLRQEYRDPLDPKGKWRFIHVNAAGVLLDSINQPLGNNCGNPAGIGQTSSTSSMQGGGSSFGSSSFGSSSMGSSSMGGSSAGCSNSMGTQGGVNGIGANSTAAGSSQIGPTSSFFGSSSNQIQGALIAGVAATSHHESIRIWQKHHHYDEWEFLGIDMGIFGIQVGMPGVSSGPTGMGQQSPSQGFGSPQGNFGSSNATTTFGSGNSSPNFGSPSN